MLLNAEEKIEIAENNLKLIHHVAKGFSNTGITHEELVGIGSVGYTKALNAFDKDSNVKFSTYAYKCIENEIKHFLRKERKHLYNTVLSGYALYTDGEGNELTMEDTLSGEHNDEAQIEDLILLKEDIKILLNAIKRLPEREQYIIRRRYGLDGKKVSTQHELAEELDMSQANISKLEQGIVKKLFRYLNGRIKLEENGFYRDCDIIITDDLEVIEKE